MFTEFSTESLAEQASAVERFSFNRRIGLTTSGTDGFNHRVDEAVTVFVADGAEEAGSLGNREPALTDERGVLAADIVSENVLNDTFDELTTVRNGDFLVPLHVGKLL